MTASDPPVLVWLRRDLRLADNPALTRAAGTGRPVIPVAILDPETDAIGAAARWRWGLSVEAMGTALNAVGSRLILRRGPAQQVIDALIAETGATAVVWGRLYDPASVARDTGVKAALKAQGVEARSLNAHLLIEPWDVETKTGGFYRVYTPFWNAVRDRAMRAPDAAPRSLRPPDVWPASDQLVDWHLGDRMNRGASVVRPHLAVGEAAAVDRLTAFIDSDVARYADRRDLPAVDGTSRLSENLTTGEISTRTAWAAGMAAREGGAAGAEVFLKELVWREFAYHLMHHTPHITERNWKREWDAFSWNTDPSHPHARAWRQGRTGIRFVDAGMREMYVTGTMHNRARMIVASYLTKHLLTHWKIGADWFADCLVDWDPASNAMGWQWAAGSGPDAAPYFRVFNPVSQREKFDPDRAYVDRWIAEARRAPSPQALSYFDAVPRAWGLSPAQPYPDPVVDADTGRRRALDAYAARGDTAGKA
jgi:deoxyribodipyrimidine photo-lyase